MTAARIAQDGKLLYILLLGVYETRERAERAIENIPPPFADLNLWIRPLRSLQAAMTDANNLSGSDAF
jgi:septal ring-binding cell division protein DamX